MLSRVRIAAVLHWTGMLLIALALLQAGLVVRVLAGARAVDGEVVELVAQGGSDGSPVWRPRVAFTDGDGRLHRITAGIGSNPPAYAVGERMTVYYDPRHLDEPRPGGFLQLWLLPSVFAVIGLLCSALAVLLSRLMADRDGPAVRRRRAPR